MIQAIEAAVFSERQRVIREYRAGLTGGEVAELTGEAEARVSQMPIPIDAEMRAELVESAMRRIVAKRLGLPGVWGDR